MYRMMRMVGGCLNRKRLVFLFAALVSLVIFYLINSILFHLTDSLLLKQQHLINSQKIKSLNLDNNFKLGINRPNLIKLVNLVVAAAAPANKQLGNNNSSSSQAEMVLSELLEVEPVYQKFNKEPIPVRWFTYDYYFYTNEKLERAYTIEEHGKLMDLFEMVTVLFGQNEIEFMLKDGSLIGTYRHFDVVPWDDDADILISRKDYDRLVQVLKSSQNVFPNLNWTKNMFSAKRVEYLKVFLRDSPRAGEQKWTTPYIDIFYYYENETHIWEEFHAKYHGLKSNVFPLRLRPFGKWWLPCPKRPMKYFRSYGMANIFEDCVGSLWDHRNERKQVKYASKCSELKRTYPFVEHTCFINSAPETQQLATTSSPQRFYYMSAKQNDADDDATPKSSQQRQQQICIESLIIDDIILKQLVFVY